MAFGFLYFLVALRVWVIYQEVLRLIYTYNSCQKDKKR